MSRPDKELGAAVAVYRAAVERMLVRFYKLDETEAKRRVTVWTRRISPPTILHGEPFMTAAALAGESVEKTNERFHVDGPEAERIWDACIAKYEATATAAATAPTRRLLVFNTEQPQGVPAGVLSSTQTAQPSPTGSVKKNRIFALGATRPEKSIVPLNSKKAIVVAAEKIKRKRSLGKTSKTVIQRAQQRLVGR